jgi:transcriptional regulator with XRE-family HTH domain
MLYTSTLADVSSVNLCSYVRRGGLLELPSPFVVIVSAMPDEGDEWRGRLRAAIAASGKSRREIAKEAGLSHGYLTSLLNEGKAPTISNFMALAKVFGKSVGELAEGFPVSKETQRWIKVWDALPKRERDRLLELGEALAKIRPE